LAIGNLVEAQNVPEALLGLLLGECRPESPKSPAAEALSGRRKSKLQLLD
jgi:hypothetical protein